jgi:hypothetical protein
MRAPDLAIRSKVPEGAVFEAELGPGVALYDVSALLKKTTEAIKEKQKRKDAEQKRPVSQIVRVYHHNSGAKGRDGFAGLLASARFSVEHRSFPGAAYTYWLPMLPDVDGAGRFAVYRAQPDDVVSWHTGGAANRHGIAVCWQGNLTAELPSVAQYHMANELCRWLDKRHQLDPKAPHSLHARAGTWGGKAKATCPGPHVDAWVEAYLVANVG